MAAAIIFLCLIWVMFQAGYQWRSYELTFEHSAQHASAEPHDPEAALDGLVYKI